jgi:hypothetical protein
MINLQQDIASVQAQLLSRRSHDLERCAGRGGHDKRQVDLLGAPDVSGIANLKQDRPGKKNCQAHVLEYGRRRIASVQLGWHASGSTDCTTYRTRVSGSEKWGADQIS